MGELVLERRPGVDQPRLELLDEAEIGHEGAPRGAPSAATRAAPSRSRRTRSPARPCSRRASRRQGSRPSARHPAGTATCGRSPPRKVRPEPVRRGVVSVRRERDDERRAGVEMPDLGRVDPVPSRDLAGARGGSRSRSRRRVRSRRARRGRSRGNARPRDAARRSRRRTTSAALSASGPIGRQNLFFHSRSAWNTSPGSAPSMPDGAGDRRLAGAQERVGRLLLRRSSRG